MPDFQRTRASDRSNFGNAASTGFVVRKRMNVRQVYRLCLAAALITLGVAILVYNETLFGSMMCVLVGSGSLYLGRHIERLQRLLQATEFMNAVFSSSLGQGWAFCLVVTYDGEIVYLNRQFQNMFPAFLQQPERNLAKLMTMHNVSAASRSKVTALLEKNGKGAVPIVMEHLGDRPPLPLTLSIDPVERPTGFALVRGQ